MYCIAKCMLVSRRRSAQVKLSMCSSVSAKASIIYLIFCQELLQHTLRDANCLSAFSVANERARTSIFDVDMRLCLSACNSESRKKLFKEIIK
jgi:hypothetical protein